MKVVLRPYHYAPYGKVIGTTSLRGPNKSFKVGKEHFDVLGHKGEPALFVDPGQYLLDLPDLELTLDVTVTP